MNETALTYARRSYRLMQIVVYGLMVLYLGLAGAFVLGWIPVLVAVVLGVFVGVFYLPVLRIEETTPFVTDRSRSEVLEQFQSVENPIAIAAYALADEEGITVHENGATYETTQLFGLRTARTRYETTQQPNDDLRVQSWRNETESTAVDVLVEDNEDGLTVLRVAGGRVNRMSLRSFCLLLIRGTQLTTVFEANGYEIRESDLRVGLR